MPITNLQEKFVHELSDIYDAEHQFLEGQKEMAEKATDQDLKSAIQNHIMQTEQHIGNLEQAFRELGQEPRRKMSEVAQGLVSEAQQSIQEARDDSLRDCLIDAAVIKVEHFEMGSYRGMLTGARLMGEPEVANMLNVNLQQEEETARIAEQSAEKLLQKAQQAEISKEVTTTEQTKDNHVTSVLPPDKVDYRETSVLPPKERDLEKSVLPPDHRDPETSILPPDHRDPEKSVLPPDHRDPEKSVLPPES